MGIVGSIFKKKAEIANEVVIQPPKPPPPPRKPPLNKVDAILKSDDAKQIVMNGVKHFPPGTVFRWDKLLDNVNRDIPPNEMEDDPVRLNITIDQLKSILRQYYYDLKSISTDGIHLLREYLPDMYKEHSFQLGKRISQKERDEKGIKDDCYSYGEIDSETFSTIFAKICHSFGEMKDGIFYDLGCGVGNLVYSAAFIGNFVRVVGVDHIESLLERGSKRFVRWDRIKEKLPTKMANIDFEWNHDDFIEAQYWVEATFIFLHWTCFTLAQRYQITETMTRCREGTIIVTISHSIPNPDFELLIKDSCDVSWGRADYYVHEKLSPPKR